MKTLLLNSITQFITKFQTQKIEDVEEQEDLLNMKWVGDGDEEFEEEEVEMSDYHIVLDDFSTIHVSQIKTDEGGK